jgi:hypothetical protein
VLKHKTAMAKTRVGTQASPCAIRGGLIGTGTRFSRRPSLFPCEYRSTATLLTHALFGGWAMGSLSAQFHRDIFSSHRDNKTKIPDIQTWFTAIHLRYMRYE